MKKRRKIQPHCFLILILAISIKFSYAQLDNTTNYISNREGILIEISNEYKDIFDKSLSDFKIFKTNQSTFSIVIDSSFLESFNNLKIPYEIKGDLYSIRAESAPNSGVIPSDPNYSPDDNTWIEKWAYDYEYFWDDVKFWPDNGVYYQYGATVSDSPIESGEFVVLLNFSLPSSNTVLERVDIAFYGYKSGIGLTQHSVVNYNTYYTNRFSISSPTTETWHYINDIDINQYVYRSGTYIEVMHGVYAPASDQAEVAKCAAIFYYVDPSLTVTPSNYDVSYSSGETPSYTISSNTSWTISESSSWVTSLSRTSGTGNSSFTASYSENTSTSQRSATITVSGGGITRYVTVTQAGAPAPADLQLSSLNTNWSVPYTGGTDPGYVNNNGDLTLSWNTTINGKKWISRL